MTFRHYVELGSVFEVERISSEDDYAICMVVRQSGRDCTTIVCRIAAA